VSGNKTVHRLVAVAGPLSSLLMSSLGTAIAQAPLVLGPALIGAYTDLQYSTGLALPGGGGNGFISRSLSSTSISITMIR